MARPRKVDTPDLGEAKDLTAGLIERLACPADKSQVFLRDTKAPGLRVRATAPSTKNPQGLKAFVFEAKLNRQTIRRTIGDVRVLDIESARTEARRLAVVIRSDGDDPRELERRKDAAKAAALAADAAKLEAAKVAAATVGEVWSAYIEERRPHWGERHYRDHLNLSKAGGKVIKRGTDGRGVTIDMPLYPLMGYPLKDLTAGVIEAWAVREAKSRPTSARLALRCLKVFLGWCAEQPAYSGLVNGNPAKTKKARESLGKPSEKSDVLQRGQLAAWFAAVQQIQNPVIAAYLQVLLLTGARPGEVIALRRDDVNTQWKGLAIRDKVEGTREIPLTPYVAHLLEALPRRNEWVFSSPTSSTGHLTTPRSPHARACKVAGLKGLTLHGLRRSFASLTEWLEVPVGVVAQIQGHKPSATREKHYIVRPLELLALHHNRIEAWILEQAGVKFDAKAEPGKLRAVAS